MPRQVEIRISRADLTLNRTTRSVDLASPSGWTSEDCDLSETQDGVDRP